MERYEIEWEQKIEYLTVDVEAAESDIKALKQEKADAEKARDQVRESKKQAEKELNHMEKQRNQLQPITNSIDKELKNSGQIKFVSTESSRKAVLFANIKMVFVI